MANFYNAGRREVGGFNPLAAIQEKARADRNLQRQEQAAAARGAPQASGRGPAPWAFDPTAVTVIGPDNREDEALARQLARQAAIRNEAGAADVARVQARGVDDMLARTGGSTTRNRMTGDDSGLMAMEGRGRALDPMAMDARDRARKLEDEARLRGQTIQDRQAAEAEAGRERGAAAGQNTKLAAAKVLSEAVATGDPATIQAAVTQIQAMLAQDGGDGAEMPADAPGILLPSGQRRRPMKGSARFPGNTPAGLEDAPAAVPWWQPIPSVRLRNG
jgi:hypothetical protein